MTTTTGHIIRIVGLVFEMVGVWGAYRSMGSRDPVGFVMPDKTVLPWTWVAVGIGFFLWLTGRIIVDTARARSKQHTRR
jgi:hypothetical protein